MACHPNPVFTPEQEARIREIVADALGAQKKSAERAMLDNILAQTQDETFARIILNSEVATLKAVDACPVPSRRGTMP